jgi:hypothetical protein
MAARVAHVVMTWLDAKRAALLLPAFTLSTSVIGSSLAFAVDV